MDYRDQIPFSPGANTRHAKLASDARTVRAHGKAAGLAALLLCTVALPALAQVAGTPGSTEVAQADTSTSTAQTTSSASSITEIVVTARRRAESAHDVPQTINALSADALVEQGVHTEADLQSAVPGLVIQAGNNGSMENYIIRGESVDAYSGSPPGVQPYINEVPQSGVNATAFYDLQNVQVLKGPQGTLFGRNSTGGAVLFQTQEPGNNYGGFASLEYGNLDRLVVQGAADLPIVKDKVLLRIAGADTSGGAYIYNMYNGKTLGDQEEQSGRLSLALKPGGDFTNTTTAQYANYGGTNAPDVIYYTAPCGTPGGVYTCNNSPSVPAFNNLVNGTSGLLPGYPAGYVYPGGVATLRQFELSNGGPYTVDQNGNFDRKGNSYFIVNKSAYQLTDSISLSNIFGYTYSKIFWQYDDDYTPYPTGDSSFGSPPYEFDQTYQYSDEFQVQGKAFNDRLTWIAGFFWIKNDDYYYSPIGGAHVVPPNGGYFFSVAYAAYTGDTSYAVFNQMSYKVTDKLNVTIGARGTWEDVSVEQLNGSVFGPGHGQSDSESDPSWTASVDYHFDNETMGYLTTRGSWRRGGFNVFAAPGATTLSTAATGGNYFLPETIKDVEIGAKYDGRVSGMPVHASVDAYNAWIDNLQKTAYVVIAGNAASASVNVPGAEVSGIEGDFKIVPTDWLRLGATASYTYGRFTDASTVLFGLPATFGPFGDVPRLSGSIFGAIQKDLPSDLGSLTYRTDMYAQTGYYFSNLGDSLTPGTRIPGYALVNMRLEWANMFGKGITGSLWVKNLTDRVYYTGGTAGVQDWSVEGATLGLPRTYGFGLRYEF